MITNIKNNWTKIAYIITGTLIFLIVAVVVKNAWLCDDSYISFRTADNFINGFGLRWNIAERVQSFTNTLWLFVLIPFFAITGEYYFTSLAISILVTLAALIIFILKNKNRISTITALVLLLFSSSFIDYSTSGLENPLSHLLITVVLILFLKKKNNMLLTSFVMSLAVLNRTDHLLIIFPMIVFLIINSDTPLKYVIKTVVGFTPFILWTLFSLLYYGFPCPNTAYAKLNSGLNKMQLLKSGFLYVQDFMHSDPSGTILICAAILYLLLERNRKFRCILTGMTAYIMYIIYIGGDFMSGRFFSIIVFISAYSFSAVKKSTTVHLISVLLMFGLLIFSINSDRVPISTDGKYCNPKIVNGIADERGYYYRYTGLFNDLPFSEKPKDPFREKGIRKGNLIIKDGVGLSGFNYGADFYILDRYALSDPLLSRIPFQYPWEIKRFRAGHMPRMFPDGYIESAVSGNNIITDPSLRKYYDAILNITRNDLLSTDRLIQIFKMNLGFYDHLIEDYTKKRVFYSAELRSDYKKRSLVNSKGIHRGKVRRASTVFPKGRFLVYGPYINLKAGKYKTGFEILTSGTENDHIGRVEVFYDKKVKAYKDIIHKKSPKRKYTKLELFFELKEMTSKVEFRVKYFGNGTIESRKIRLTKLDDSVNIPANLSLVSLHSKISLVKKDYITVRSNSGQIVYTDLPGVEIEWLGIKNRDRYLMNWIGPDGKPIFSKYIYASSRKRVMFYPYLGKMPLASGSWKVEILKIAYLDTAKDISIQTLTFNLP